MSCRGTATLAAGGKALGASSASSLSTATKAARVREASKLIGACCRMLSVMCQFCLFKHRFLSIGRLYQVATAVQQGLQVLA